MKSKLSFLIDLDGTIYHGNKVLPYVNEFFKWIAQREYSFLLVTNNANHSSQEISDNLNSMGIIIDESKIITSGQIAIWQMEKKKMKSAYIIGSRHLLKLAENAGIVFDSKEPQCVLVSQDDELTFEKLNIACKFIQQRKAFFCTDIDNAIPAGGIMYPHTGAINAFIKEVTGSSPKNLGKPAQYFYEYAAQTLNSPKESLYVVGDNLKTDIAGGVKNGVKTCLMMTGMTTFELLDASEIKPEFVFEDLNQLIKYFEIN